MIASKEMHKKLYLSISDPISSLKIENYGGLSIAEMEQKLIKLEIEIYTKIVAALDLKRSPYH